MNKTNIQSHRIRLSALSVIVALGASSMLAACGGGEGGSLGGGTSTATGSVVSGPITGFGSVIVNGVRFDDSAATVSFDDDAGSSGDLRLGMMVEIEGEQDDATATGKARQIASASHVRGTVAAIDKTGKQLTVLGVVASVSAGTVFEGMTGLDDPAFKVGDVVEIHGIRDAQGMVKATRIEKKSADAGVRVVGAVKNLNTAAKTFTVNGMTVKYDQLVVDNKSIVLADDMLVRVKGTRVDATTISAARIKDVTRRAATREGKRIEVEGVVSGMASTTSFNVDELKVDASKAKFEGTVASGARIEVEGRVVGGVLIATKVEVKDEDKEERNEMHGLAASVDLSAKTLVVRNVKVRWDGNTEFRTPLTASALANGAKVEVKGRTVGDTVVATRIKLED
jgi:hypothetical protein